MNNKVFLLYTFICLIGYSCSPKVGVKITKSYPPQASDTPVAIFTREQDVPPQSETIGTIKISDTGFTNAANCDSAAVFSIAETETRKAGGNGLLITRHLRPSFWSGSCHQIAGTMLLVPDIYLTPEMMILSDETSYRPSRQLPRMSFTLDAGYNWRTAKIDDKMPDFQKHVYKQIKSGFLWNGSLAYYFNNYYGIGFSFQQFITSTQQFAQDLNTGQTGVWKIKDRITYFGPAFMMQAPLGKSSWLWDMCLSIGYIGYMNKQNIINQKAKFSGASIGFQTEIGLSYKISQKWGIGCKLLSTTGTISQYTVVDNNGYKTTLKLDDDTGYESLAQFGISLGVRYYIKSK